jgi:hypothetical protein
MPGNYIFSFLVSGMKYLKRDSTITIKNHSISDKNHNEVHTLYANIEFNRLMTHKIRFQATKKLRSMSRKFCLLE